MKENSSYLYTKDSKRLQISYAQYTELMKKAEETQRIQRVKRAVLSDLRQFLVLGLGGEPVNMPEPIVKKKAVPAMKKNPKPKKGSIEFVAKEPGVDTQQTPVKRRGNSSPVPPLKGEIARHFNRIDESGRLFNVFTQYYTCLNDACGGTVRVTLKDGLCSLWNYDEWEEFAFVDIFEDLLRMTIDPRYTTALESLSLCETPRLISNRRNAVSIQVGDLNNVLLDVLAKAFSEVGMQKK